MKASISSLAPDSPVFVLVAVAVVVAVAVDDSLDQWDSVQACGYFSHVDERSLYLKTAYYRLYNWQGLVRDVPNYLRPHWQSHQSSRKEKFYPKITLICCGKTYSDRRKWIWRDTVYVCKAK